MRIVSLLLMGCLGLTSCHVHRTITGKQEDRAKAPDRLEANQVFGRPGVHSVLDKLDSEHISRSVLDQALEAFFGSPDAADFKQRLGKVPIPEEAKTALWDLRFGSLCQAMNVVSTDYVPKEIPRFEAYYQAVSQCLAEGETTHDTSKQAAAAKRLLTLEGAEIEGLKKQTAELRKELDSANGKVAIGINQLEKNQQWLLQQGLSTEADKSAIDILQRRLAMMSLQYENLRSQYDALERQYNVLLGQRGQPSFPRAMDCEDSGNGTLACIPGPH